LNNETMWAISMEEPEEHKGTETFYLIWSPEAGAPTVKHYEYEEAKEEAERLAKKHVGRRFYIMESFKLFKAETPVNTYEMEDD